MTSYDDIKLLSSWCIYILLLNPFDIRITSYTNFVVKFEFIVQKHHIPPNIGLIKTVSFQICKFLHISIPRHVENKWLPWQQFRTTKMETRY